METTFFNIVAYIFVNLFLFSSWYLILFKKKHYLPFIDRLIGTFIFGLTQIVFTEMLLGVLFKSLYALPLFLLNISISLIVLTLAIIFDKNNNPPPTSPFDKGGCRGILKGVMGGLKGILSEFKDKTIQFFNIIKRDIVLLCIFILFSISVCWIIFTGYLFPSYTWDALWYHLPAIGRIIQSGSIQETITPFFIDSYINAIPKNIELVFIWSTIFLKSDIIVDLSQLPFTIAGVLTVYSMGIKLKIKREYAIYTSFLFFFTPIVILQSATNYVDIAVSVLFLIAINFLLCNGLQNRLAILLGGLSSGLLIGSKGSGPLFIVFLSAIFIIRLIRDTLKERKGNQVKEGVISYSVFFLIPAILMSGYWFIKNWALYDNPLYPVEVSFLNFKFKGLIGGIIEPMPSVLEKLSPLSRLIYSWMERVEYYFYDSRLSGFGPIWFILLLPSIPIAVFYAIKRKNFDFLLISAISIIIFSIYPRNWNPRYVIFILGLGCLSFGLALDYFEERQKTIKIIMLLLVIYTFFTANSPCIMPWKIGEFVRLPAKERTIARHAPFNIDLQARQDYGLWIWISNNMSKGDALTYTFEPLFLRPLWNRDFSNKVLYIKSENFNEWIKNLKDNDVTHILIKQNSIEDKKIQEFKRLVYNTPSWLGVSKNLAERFKVVYSDENYKVLRFGY